MPDYDQMLQRQKLLADFGEFTLGCDDLDQVLTEACRLVATALGTRRAKVMEIQDEQDCLFVRAGVGWGSDIVGQLHLSMRERSSETYSIREGRPVITRDVNQEIRFEVADFMREAGVAAFVNVPIRLPGGKAYGLLQVDDTEPRDFSEADAEFLRTYATILGPVIDRLFKLRELRSTEERFRLTVGEALDYAIFVTDGEDRITDWLPGAEAVFGWSAEEVIGQPAAIVFTPEDREAGEPEKEVVQATAEGISPNVRWHMRKDGSRVFIEGSVRTLRNIAGTLTGFLKIGQDVTERRAAEARRRENEERGAFLLSLNDALRPLAAPLDIQTEACRHLGEHLGVSASYGEIEGDLMTLRPGYAQGMAPLEGTFHYRTISRAYAHAYALGAPMAVPNIEADPHLGEAERDILRTAGIVAFIGMPLVKNGRLVAAFGLHSAVPRAWTTAEMQLAREVAERTWAAVERAKAEAALRASEERFRGFAEALTDVLWIADARGERLEYLSPAFERVFGMPRNAVLADLSTMAALVHPEDLDRFRSAMPRALAGETLTIYYRVVQAGGRIVHLRDTGFPIRDGVGTIAHVAGIVQDVTDIDAATAALEAEKERFRTLAEGIPQLVWRSADEGQWTWASPQWLDYTGQSQEESHGLGWLEVVHPDDREATMMAWLAAQAHGQLEVEHRVRRAADGSWRWHQTRALPVRDGATAQEPDRHVLEWLGTTTDIDDLKRLQAEQGILLAELQHRTRNLLSVVRNVARKSIPPSPQRDEYDARLAAIGRVQGFLARSGAYTASLRDLVEAELQAAGNGASGRVTVDGPSVELPGQGIQPLALALHELATNAAKYGALSEANAAGRLSVSWQIQDGNNGPCLRLSWRESGVVMPADPPERRGYGTELITRALPYQLNAETQLQFTPDGMRCEVELPAGSYRNMEEAA